MAKGCRVTTASRKIIVSPASRILSAISFGVFWRDAPSTRLIMRSRNVSPGFEVMRTLISSESTRVPPVTAERSPPDSRITGADSPVIADSSTEATPSITSPSPGMNSPAATRTMSPERNLELGRRSSCAVVAELACFGFRAGFAQSFRLRFAAALGHGFREIGEKNREPEPQRDLQSESEFRRDA